MDVFEAIRTRRAIKKFDSSYKMTPEQVKSLMELVILSPTSYNQQNWRFITVTDQSVKEKISKAARTRNQPKDGSLVVVLCGNMSAWKDEPLQAIGRIILLEKQETGKASLLQENTRLDSPQAPS